ncbi:MAG: aminopeptidase P N-terminal domain-containing protein [Polyangiaceae bacterium]|nr:aminopeptidase P N-terminal domain-containing protein [Polyangiaceae bacterium]
MHGEHAARRAAVLAAIHPGVMVVPARREGAYGGVGEPFRQDSDFWYLTGFDEPDAVLVLRSGAERPCVVFVRPRDPERERWYGPRVGVEGAPDALGVDAAFPLAELEAELPKLLENVSRLFFRLGRDRRLDDRVLEAVDRVRARARQGVFSPHAIVDPGTVLGPLRSIKSAAELAEMERAIAITCAAHRAAMQRARAGVSEAEIEAVLLAEFRAGGARRPAYPPIVAGGKNATILHYDRNDGRFEAGDLVLIDAGCEYMHYAADVTRTFPVCGRFTSAQAEIYELVLAAQGAAVQAVRPGVTLDIVHGAAVEVLTRGLVDLGLVQGPVATAIEEERVKPYYMHRTSHFLGLDVHDAGVYSDAEGPCRLKEGMVITVEPGLYFASSGEAGPFAGIGVRIEDDVLVSSDGALVLTSAAPKSVEAIEAACAP